MNLGSCFKTWKQITKFIANKTNSLFPLFFTGLWQVNSKFTMYVLNSDFPLTTHIPEKSHKNLCPLVLII